MIPLLIADDEEFVRLGLRSVLETGPLNWRVVAEAANVTDAVAMARMARPGIAIVDLDIPGGGAGNLLRLFSSVDTRVVVYSDEHVTGDIRSALYASGAIDFLAKDGPLGRIPEVLNRVAGQLGDLPALAPLPGAKLCRAKLSRRELEVARMLARGLRNKDMAECLNLSVRTVEAHRENVRRKLQVESVSQLARHFSDAPRPGEALDRWLVRESR